MLTVNPNLHGLAWPFMAVESESWVGLKVATISVQDDYMNTYRRTRLTVSAGHVVTYTSIPQFDDSRSHNKMM